jgi:hypothetical protein
LRQRVVCLAVRVVCFLIRVVCLGGVNGF